MNKHQCKPKPMKLPVAALSRCPPNNQFKKWQDPERDTCQKPKVEPPSQKADIMLWGTMGFLVLAGGFAVYAKGNQEVRDWLSLYAPWFDNMIAVAYQENMTYLEFAMSSVEDIKNRLVLLLEPTKECDVGIIIDEPSEDTSDQVDEIDEDIDEDLSEAELPCDALQAPVITKDISDIDGCMRELADDAIQNYAKARDACKYYNELIVETMNNFSIRGMKKLRIEMEERLALVKKSVENAQSNIKQLDDLTHYLECGGVSEQKEKVEATIEMSHELRNKIKTVNNEYQWENNVALASDAQWTQLEVLMDRYTFENQCVYPMLDYEDDDAFVYGDVDFVIYHTLRYVNKLREDIKDPSESMTNRINRGLEMLPQGEMDKMLRNSKISALYLKRKAELEAEYVTRIVKLKAANDTATKEALERQLKRHEEDVRIGLIEKEEKVMKSFNKIVDDQVIAQKKIFDSQLRAMQLNQDVIEKKMKERLKADTETKRSQDLWSAGASLLAATKKGDPCISVCKELRAIERSASCVGDTLVLTVLNSIPQSVWDKGVVPESVLREKYHSMEKVALNVALVEQDGAPLPVYFISWLQSALLFMKLHSIPQIELDNPPKEPYNFKHLDTFDLLQRARYFIERGNIAAAVRYVSALEGASRSASRSWYEAARAHLETRQAALAVIAHAASLGLKYI